MSLRHRLWKENCSSQRRNGWRRTRRKKEKDPVVDPAVLTVVEVVVVATATEGEVMAVVEEMAQDHRAGAGTATTAITAASRAVGLMSAGASSPRKTSRRTRPKKKNPTYYSLRLTTSCHQFQMGVVGTLPTASSLVELKSDMAVLSAGARVLGEWMLFPLERESQLMRLSRKHLLRRSKASSASSAGRRSWFILWRRRSVLHSEEKAIRILTGGCWTLGPPTT
jgi:hypothetical protein